MKRKVIETSQEAYRSLDVKQLNERYKLILDALDKLGEATTEEVAAYSRISHDKIWKRFSELSNMGLIYRPGNKRMMKSGRYGYTWSLIYPQRTEKQTGVSNGTEDVKIRDNVFVQVELF